MKPIPCMFAITLALLGALLPSLAGAQSVQTAQSRVDAIAWHTQPQDILQALQQAEMDGTPVMIYFYAGETPDCQQMEENTFSDDDVQLLSEQFVCIRVDAGSAPGQRLMAQLGISGLPCVQFFNQNRKVNAVNGYEAPEAFIWDMRKALYSDLTATL